MSKEPSLFLISHNPIPRGHWPLARAWVRPRPSVFTRGDGRVCELRQFLVRGLRKVKAVALWYALAHKLMRGMALAAPA